MRAIVAGLGLIVLGCAGIGAESEKSEAAPANPGPSFDCGKADSPNQRRICASVELSKLDRQLAEAWKVATADPARKAQLLAGQREWLAGNAQCSDDPCLAARYQSRIGFLEGVAAAGTLPAPSHTGHWSGDRGGISVLEEPTGTLQVGISVSGGGSPEYGPNLGQASGKVTLAGDKGVLRLTEWGECTFTFTFHGEAVDVQQDGSDGACGFGMGVYADGTYTRRDTTRPSKSELSGEL